MRRAVCSAVLSLALTAARAGAEPVELPVRVPLGAESHLVFELDQAEVHLTSRVEGLPALEARVAADGETADLEVTSEGGTLTVRRPPGPADDGEARLVLDARLGPGRSVTVAGRGLSVEIDEPPAADPATDPRGARSSYRLSLEGSSVELTGVYNPWLALAASSAELRGTDGAATLDLAGGSASVDGHRGSLELDAVGADVQVVDHGGRLTLGLDGGRLEVVGGDGPVAGTAAGGRLSFDGRRGGGELTGGAFEIDLRGSEGDTWNLTGRGLQATVEEVRGKIVAVLEGGALRGSRISGGLEVTAVAGAAVDLRGITGHLALDAKDGAQAWISGVAGHLEAKVEDARLEADRLDGLTLEAKRSEVAARGVGRLDPSTAAGSELTLELLASGQEAALELRGASRARLRLPVPCAVRLLGEEAPQLEVDGCDVHRGTAGAPARSQPRPTAVAVTGSEDAVLVVEGED